MPARRQDFADDNAVEAVAMRLDTVHLVADHRQSVREFIRLHGRIDPFTQPFFGEFHLPTFRYLNWRKKRRSFSKNVRRSSTP